MKNTYFLTSVVRKLSTPFLHTFILRGLFLFLVFISKAQVGIGTDDPDSSSILELESTNQGFLLPRINDVNEIKNPTDGLLIYDTKEHCVSVYANNKWSCLMLKNHKPTAAVTIKGDDLSIGETLTAEATGSDTDGDAVTFTYQWYRSDDNQGTGETKITGATSKTYTLTNDDKDKHITVKVIPDDGTEKGSTVTADYTAKISLLVTIPDDHFRAYLKAMIPNAFPDGGDKMDPNHEEVKSLLSINVHDKRIKSLQGIKYFTALTELYCFKNQLTNLDVSKNTQLTNLSCNRNKLTTLDLSKNTALTELLCSDNQLINLDVSKNTALTKLSCSYNQLKTLDVSHNTGLIELSCFKNQLTNLDVSKNTALTKLSCSYNQLKTLDVSHNTALTELYCNNNQLKTLDVSKNTALTELDCNNNQLTTLDVSKNTALTVLYCNNNQLTTLDVSKNTALTKLDCSDNQLKTLEVSKNTALTKLHCYNNQLTTLDVSKNTALTVLHCYNNQLTSLDLSENCELKKEKYGSDIKPGVSKDNIRWCSS